MGKLCKLLIFCCMWSHQMWAQEIKDPQNMPVKPEHTDCQELPDSFDDLQSALTAIKSSRFYYEQKIKTTRKNGLMGANYYSCDFKNGYLIIRFDNVEQLYPQVEMALWKRFQQTRDIDGFYAREIRVLPQIIDHE